jgi:hypothetical protein
MTAREVDPLSLIVMNFNIPALTPHLHYTEGQAAAMPCWKRRFSSTEDQLLRKLLMSDCHACAFISVRDLEISFVCCSELEAELLGLELGRPIQAGGDWRPREANLGVRACTFCRAEFGILMNKGVDCCDCGCRICKTCRVRNDGGTAWLCLRCDKRRWVWWRTLMEPFVNIISRAYNVDVALHEYDVERIT